VVFALAEVLGEEELGQADELGAGAGGFSDEVGGVVEVLRGGGGAGHLDQGYAGWARHLRMAPWCIRKGASDLPAPLYFLRFMLLVVE
jgi:hypothetical protein